MLVETKAKVGVFSIALQAYLPQFPELVPEFEEQYAAFKKTLPDTVELIDGGLVTTKEQAQAAGDKFRAADVDLVILQLLTYCTSYNMLPAVRDLDVPVVVVNLQKLRCLDFDTAGTAEWPLPKSRIGAWPHRCAAASAIPTSLRLAGHIPA